MNVSKYFKTDLTINTDYKVSLKTPKKLIERIGSLKTLIYPDVNIIIPLKLTTLQLFNFAAEQMGQNDKEQLNRVI